MPQRNSTPAEKPNWLLISYAWLIGYRFHSSLGPPLEVPPTLSTRLTVKDVQDKARGSLATSGVFFTFSIAVLAALIGAGDTRDKLGQMMAQGNFWWKVFFFLAGMILPYLVIWMERYISAASVEAQSESERNKFRRRRYLMLIPCLALSLFLFIAVPRLIPEASKEIARAFSLSGFGLIVLSSFFLLFAIEFYDSASGWRSRRRKAEGSTPTPTCASTQTSEQLPTGNDEPPALHFHLASIASGSTLIGVCLALVGVSLLLCLVDFRLGRLTTCVTLLVVTAMTEIERALWNAQPS